MKAHSKKKIYFNIVVSLFFVLLGIYLITKDNSGRKIFDIPSNALIGFLVIISNAMLSVKWIYLLFVSKKE